MSREGSSRAGDSRQMCIQWVLIFLLPLPGRVSVWKLKQESDRYVDTKILAFFLNKRFGEGGYWSAPSTTSVHKPSRTSAETRWAAPCGQGDGSVKGTPRALSTHAHFLLQGPPGKQPPLLPRAPGQRGQESSYSWKPWLWGEEAGKVQIPPTGWSPSPPLWGYWDQMRQQGGCFRHKNTSSHTKKRHYSFQVDLIFAASAASRTETHTEYLLAWLPKTITINETSVLTSMFW